MIRMSIARPVPGLRRRPKGVSSNVEGSSASAAAALRSDGVSLELAMDAPP
jgi:hypothetical protein